MVQVDANLDDVEEELHGVVYSGCVVPALLVVLYSVAMGGMLRCMGRDSRCKV